MVSGYMQKELRITYERLRISVVVLFFWVIVVTLDITGVIQLDAEGVNFLVYAILATSSVVFLILGLGIQTEPLIKEMIKNRKDIEKLWKSNEKLKPEIDKRALISEIVLILAILLMLVSLLFVIV